MNGNITSAKKHDVYGLTRDSVGTAKSKHGWVGSLGHTSDDETGLVYMRARHYDPVVGRFSSEDPARDGNNWFGYCSGDPVNRVDESGKQDVSLLELLNQVGTYTTKQLGAVFLLALAVAAIATYFGNHEKSVAVANIVLSMIGVVSMVDVLISGVGALLSGTAVFIGGPTVVAILIICCALAIAAFMLLNSIESGSKTLNDPKANW